MRLNKLLKSKKGVISIEAIPSITGILVVIILATGLLSYNLPRIQMEKEIQSLAQICKIHGGLTNEDVNTFMERMDKRGIDRDKVKVIAVTEQNNINAIGVSPITSTDKNYINRKSGELIEIKVELPANKSVFNFVLGFFGLKNDVSDKYILREVVASERW